MFRFAVLTPLAVACLTTAALVTGVVDAGEKKGVYEVKQGGYVEKVDPNVDFKDRLPRIPPREPAESMEGFHIEPSYRWEQVAAEPLTRDSIDLAFDENGRAYVVEMTSYAQRNGAQFLEPTGRVSRLEDTDHDGKFDTSQVFVDKLLCPTGVTCFDGGLFIACAPDILYCKDTDGDGRADTREVVITGFSLSNPNALPSSLRWSLDNRIEGMTSTSGGELRAVRWETGGEGRKAETVQSRGRDFSFDPRTGELRLESGGAQFGMSFDAWGRKFECSNSAPVYMIMYEDRYLARNPYLAAPSPRIAIWQDGSAVYRSSPVEPWRVIRTELRVKGSFSGPIEGGGTPAGYFTAACGTTVYTGSAMPELCGDVFVCEGASNVLHHMRLEPDGVGFSAHRVEQKHEFLASDEIWFRPIQFAQAPDGAFYLADMYREVFEHPDAIPPSAKKYMDLTSGSERGRIYRIVPEGFQQPPPVRLGDMPTVELVALLAHPNRWHRVTASRLLFERQDRRAIDPLVKLAAESVSPLGRMHAMYALDGLGALGADVVLARLDDEHPRVREHAVRLSEHLLADAPTVREKLYTMTGDDDLRVRYQLAFTLGEIPGSRATAALAEIAQRDVADRWIRLAVLSSCFGRAGELSGRLSADAAWRAGASGRALLEQLAEQAGLQNRSDQVAEVFGSLESFSGSERPLAQAVVRGLSKGLAAAKSPLLASLSSEGSGSRAGDLLAEMIGQAKQEAANSEKPLEERVAAIRSLGLASFDEVIDLLADLLDSTQPQEVQIAAIQALNHFAEEEVAEVIVEAWVGFTPKVRSEAAEALFARPERLSVLLAAIQDQAIMASQLAPARVQFLMSHPDSSIRDEASRLLTSAQVAPRAEVVEAWSDVLRMWGDVDRGRQVFRRECAKCHKLEDYGVELGLPLNTVQNRGPEAILLAVLDPNRDVLPQYLNYVVVTDDGLSITGMIETETATSITLKRAEGESDTVLRAKIDQLVNTGMSVMPEGNEKLVTKQELADVITYLMSIQ